MPRDVQGDAEDPGADRRPSAEAARRAMNFEEGHLHQVLEIAAVDVAQPAQDAMHLRAVAVEELLEHAPVAAGAREHQ